MPDRTRSDAPPRGFALVTEPNGPNADPVVIAWGEEMPDRAVVSWRLNGGGAHMGHFQSAQRAADTLSLLEPVRVIWTG